MGVAYKGEIEFSSTEVVVFPPQKWEYEVGADEIVAIDSRHIISYFRDGNICSRYEDDLWRLTYSFNEREWLPLKFAEIKDFESRQLLKRLMFAIIYFSRGRSATIKSPSTIFHFFRVLKDLHEYAVKSNKTILKLFQNKKLEKDFITEIISKKKYNAPTMIQLINFLQKIDDNIIGFHYTSDLTNEALLNKYYQESVNSARQTECIPPRILQNAQQMRWKHVERAIKELHKIILLIETLLVEPLNYYESPQSKKKAKAAEIDKYMTFRQLIQELELDSFCKEYKIQKRSDLIGYISRLTRTSRNLIYGYTGMRNNEGETLLVDCYKEKGAGTHPVIVAVEKKNGTPTEHQFVTIKEIGKVIAIHGIISKTIARHINIEEKHLPLMLNPDLMRSGRCAKHLEALSGLFHGELLLDESKLILTQDEMNLTLKTTEPNRDWDTDTDYKVGKPWKFTYHQYRRSIAVYALNTGLVSLTALGKQYRHLFEATTAHYGNGHFIAQPLAGINSKYHIKREIDDQREYYEGLAMYRDLMFNLEQPISGFAPKYAENQEINPIDQILDMETPSTLAKKIKNQEIVYSNTAIGSCKSIMPCDGHIMLFYAGCTGCSDALVNDDKLEHTIQCTLEFKKKLDIHMAGSVELRDVEKDLESLVELQKKRQGNEK